MKPQDLVILLKIVALSQEPWYHHTLAESLGISQSEVSQSLNRSRYSGLIDASRKQVNRLSLLDFIQYGVKFVFPQKPGALVRGMPTAHSAPPLTNDIASQEAYVWPYALGKVRGQAIEPLYSSVPEAAQRDPHLYALLALVDAVRVGRTRERQLALEYLRKRFDHA
jgi:hypothetical protein